MSSVEKITIALTPQVAAFVRAEAEAGRYASTSEAVREWQERRENWGYTIGELRGLIDEGLASGPAQPAGPIMERLRAKYAAMSASGEAAE